ncbi:DUF6122 family protein [Mesonia ostreae]|uniref:DUF6122 family protein n=1 Tax=Mesonia ostreae TaxID=861110 RepID=A0ABU2KFB7_9FLAO|nr:DUF6122 family protein [Mesonia ostreae]MDT0293407.1 DUF6122 family protein [Mesonia ostreae]
MLQHAVHYAFHFLVIGIIAYIFDKKNWKKYYLVLLATMLIDVDHLWAKPIFDPDRCSINFHTFHTYIAAAIYLVFLLIIKNKVLKVFFFGLLFHLFTDAIDCLWSNSWELSVLL